MTGQAAAPRGARVIPIPPPIFYLLGLAVGMAVNGLVPLPLGGRPGTLVGAAALTAAGLALTLGGVSAVMRNGTTIVPHRPVATLLTGGAFRLSRNPMYAGLAIAYLGLALLLGSWWPVALWPLVVLAVRQLAIRPEEAYLAQRFGASYADYQSRVRRWL